mmetsp:Transcript_63680/g.205172  ORF Transcript_63680/g.205172 Transcript_63680/m.205172 type:complete len:564 (+) Transcript_63680:185-1876(+)
MCMSSASRTRASSRSSEYCRDSSANCCRRASSRCFAAAFSASSCSRACCTWLSCFAREAASASRRSVCSRSCVRASRCSLSVLMVLTSASRFASSNCWERSAISCCSSASRTRQVSRSLRIVSASSVFRAPRRASSWRCTSDSALNFWSSPSTLVSFCHCCSLCIRRFRRSSSKSARSFLSSSCLSCSIFARSSAEARRTFRSEASSSAARCAFTDSWISTWSLAMRVSCSSAARWWFVLSRCETCFSTDFRRLSRSMRDWRRILSSSLLMVLVISSFISSILRNWSSRISSKDFSADSFVSSLVLSSSISCCSFLRSSCSSACSSFTLSCKSLMHSECLWRICSRELCSWLMRFTLARFLTAIIFWAKVSVFTDSSTFSSSGPRLAMSRALALPPRQSFRSIVSAESRCPWPRPMFKLLTTVPREVKTRLMPMACRLLKSSLASSTACTFLRLSEPARSTSMSLPRCTTGSRVPFFSERLSTESINRQWDLEEWQFRLVSMKVQRCWPNLRTSHISSGARIGTRRRFSQMKDCAFRGSGFTSSFGSSSARRSRSCSRVPSGE